jgi:hypothetical protein
VTGIGGGARVLVSNTQKIEDEFNPFYQRAALATQDPGQRDANGKSVPPPPRPSVSQPEPGSESKAVGSGNRTGGNPVARARRVGLPARQPMAKDDFQSIGDLAGDMTTACRQVKFDDVTTVMNRVAALIEADQVEFKRQVARRQFAEIPAGPDGLADVAGRSNQFPHANQEA